MSVLANPPFSPIFCCYSPRLKRLLPTKIDTHDPLAVLKENNIENGCIV